MPRVLQGPHSRAYIPSERRAVSNGVVSDAAQPHHHRYRISRDTFQYIFAPRPVKRAPLDEQSIRPIRTATCRSFCVSIAFHLLPAISRSPGFTRLVGSSRFPDSETDSHDSLVFRVFIAPIFHPSRAQQSRGIRQTRETFPDDGGGTLPGRIVPASVASISNRLMADRLFEVNGNRSNPAGRPRYRTELTPCSVPGCVSNTRASRRSTCRGNFRL